VKVHTDQPTLARLPWRASLVALASALIASLGLFPTTAHAITRADVLHRAHTWVAKKVLYSQHAHYAGYRRDCSGFVSMAWRLSHSYTSRTIHAVATRVPLERLKAGDAVHTPGHVAIFVKWANKAHTRYVAMEETHWGHPAMQRVRPLGRGATGLRYRRISEDPIPVANDSLTGVSALASVTGSGTVEATGSAVATGSVCGTAATPVPVTGVAASSLLVDTEPTLAVAPASEPIGAFALLAFLY
jgi:hypothetical protein